MNHKAAISDLFGTLVKNIPQEEQKKSLGQIASVLSVPAGDFGRLWLDTASERCTGVFQSNEINIGHICHRLGVSREGDQIKFAAQIVADSTTRF